MKIGHKINWSTLTNIGDVASNFSHEIDKEVESALRDRAGKVYAEYPAANFFAHITYLDNVFYAKVYRFRSIAEYIDKDSIEDIMEYLCDKYGDH